MKGYCEVLQPHTNKRLFRFTGEKLVSLYEPSRKPKKDSTKKKGQVKEHNLVLLQKEYCSFPLNVFNSQKIPGSEREMRLCLFGNGKGEITTKFWMSEELQNQLLGSDSEELQWERTAEKWQKLLQQTNKNKHLNYWIWIPSYNRSDRVYLDYSQTLGDAEYLQVVVARPGKDYDLYKEHWSTDTRRIIMQLPSTLPMTPGLNPDKGSF